jgi:diguanylate cyclase (GGDEF)-like protein
MVVANSCFVGGVAYECWTIFRITGRPVSRTLHLASLAGIIVMAACFPFGSDAQRIIAGSVVLTIFCAVAGWALLNQRGTRALLATYLGWSYLAIAGIFVARTVWAALPSEHPTIFTASLVQQVLNVATFYMLMAGSFGILLLVKETADVSVAQQLRYAEALARCSQTLLSSEISAAAYQAALAQSLEILRVAVAADRVALYRYVDLTHGQTAMLNSMQLVAAVNAPDLSPQRPATRADVLDIPQEVRDRLQVGRPFHGSIIRRFPQNPAFERYNADNGIKSLLFHPLTLHSDWWGHISVNDNTRERSWDDATIQVVRTAAEMIITFFQGWEAVGALRASEDALRQQATTDALTGAVNRRRFIELATGEIKRATRLGHPLALATIDIDYFKSINDTYGHSIGDQALIVLTRICLGHIREIDVLARFGGDEFVVLFPETTAGDAQAVMERVSLALTAQPVDVSGKPVVLTISVGIAGIASESMSLDTLLDHADHALYQAKEAGRNRVVLRSTG